MTEGADVVVIDPEAAHTKALGEAGIPHIAGDATEEALLREAGIEVAQGMVCAVDSDETNVYITITARALNPDLTIVARAGRPESVETLRRAGANPRRLPLLREWKADGVSVASPGSRRFHRPRDVCP